MDSSLPSQPSLTKEEIIQKLKELTPILQKASLGDFSGKINIPKEENELTEFLVSISLMFDDFREKVRGIEEKNKELEKIKQQLETEVTKRTQKLQEKMEDLEKINKAMVGRELKMIELKQALQKAQGMVTEGIK